MPIVITQTCLIGGSGVVLAVVVVPVSVGELEVGVPVLPESFDGAPVEGAPDPPVAPPVPAEALSVTGPAALTAARPPMPFTTRFSGSDAKLIDPLPTRTPNARIPSTDAAAARGVGSSNDGIASHGRCGRGDSNGGGVVASHRCPRASATSV